MNLIEAKRSLEAKKTKRDEAKGKRDFLMGRLKELGYGSIAKAKTALKKLKDSTKENQKTYESKLAAFEKKWGQYL